MSKVDEYGIRFWLYSGCSDRNIVTKATGPRRQSERGTMLLPRETGEGDHAKHGGGGMRAPEKTIYRARVLGREMSLPEVVLWQTLRKGKVAGLRFRRQHLIGP
jgi:hypothetical protein